MRISKYFLIVPIGAITFLSTPVFAEEDSDRTTTEYERPVAMDGTDSMAKDLAEAQALIAKGSQEDFIKEKMDALSPSEMATLQKMALDPQHSGKLPKLMEITVQVKKVSELCKQTDPACPEDAYRHVLWSYHLTKEFGPDYSKVVTDAYEDDTIRATGNTEADHKMDYQNNSLGRRYAQEGTFSDEEILEKLKGDPEAVLSAG
jgi:hypothetical protein